MGIGFPLTSCFSPLVCPVCLWAFPGSLRRVLGPAGLLRPWVLLASAALLFYPGLALRCCALSGHVAPISSTSPDTFLSFCCLCFSRQLFWFFHPTCVWAGCPVTPSCNFCARLILELFMPVVFHMWSGVFEVFWELSRAWEVCPGFSTVTSENSYCSAKHLGLWEA